LFALGGRGYSLIELLLVLGLMVLIGAMAAPRFGDSIARQRVDGAASRIVSDLNYARSVARMTSASVTVTFDPARNRYMIPTAPDPLRNGPAPYVVDLAASPYRAIMMGGAAAPVGVAMPSIGSGNSTFSITFDGFGEASSTGWIVVRAGSWSRQVSLDSSARATITRLNDSQVRALLP
jgi:type II secretory pathway pseudopilin PulG